MIHKYDIGDRISIESTMGSKNLTGTIIGQVKGAEVYRVVFDHTWEGEGILITGERITHRVHVFLKNRDIARKGNVIDILDKFNILLKNAPKVLTIDSGTRVYFYEYNQYHSKGIAEIKAGVVAEYLPSTMLYRILTEDGGVFFRKASELIVA